MDQGRRLCRRSQTRRELLRRHSYLLAGLARRLVAAGLFGHSAEDRQARRVHRGLSHPDEKTSRRRWADQPVWDRVAGPDVEPGDRRMDCATDLKFLPLQKKSKEGFSKPREGKSKSLGRKIKAGEAKSKFISSTNLD